MKLLHYLAVPILILGVLFGGSQVLAQEDFMTPFEKDENTVVLIDFANGEIENKSDLSAAAQPSGNLMPVDNPISALGKAMWFQNEVESDSNWVMIPHGEALNLQGNFTIEGWFSVAQFMHPEETWWRWDPQIINKGNKYHGDPISYAVSVSGQSHSSAFRAKDEITDGFMTVGTPEGSLLTNTWYHFIVVQDSASDIMAYILHELVNEGGEQVAQFRYMDVGSAAGHIYESTMPFFIGQGQKGTGFNGIIDEIRVSDIVRNYAYPPIISKVDASSTSNFISGESGEILASVQGFGASEIDEVTLHYQIGLDGSWESMTMNPTGEGTMYSAPLSGQSAGTVARYYISATTTAGAEARSPGAGYHGTGWWDTEDMVLDLSFEEGSGPLQDHSGYQNDVQVHGDNWRYTEEVPPALEGESSYSFELNMMDPAEAVDTTYVQIHRPTVFLNGPAEGYTIDLWFRPDSIQSEDEGGARDGGALIRRGGWTTGLYFSDEWSFKQPTPDPTGQTDEFQALSGTFGMPTDSLVGKWFHFRAGRTNSYLFAQMRDGNNNLIGEDIIEFPAIHEGDEVYLAMDDLFIAKWQKWIEFRGKLDNFRFYNYPYGVPPAFVNVDAPDLVTTDEDATISTGIQAPGSTISSAMIHYSNDGGDSWTDASLAESGGAYSANIPVQPVGTTTLYYLKVNTGDGQTATYPTNVRIDSVYSSLRWWQERDMTFSLTAEEGDTFEDASAYGHEVEVEGEVNFSDTAKVGSRSIYFNGEEGNFLEVSPPTFMTSEDFTVDFWFMADSIPPQEDNFLMAKTSIEEGIEGQLRVKFNDPGESLAFLTIFYQDDDDDDVEIEIGDTPYEPNKWYRAHYEYVGSMDTAFAQVYDADGNLMKEEGEPKELGLPYMDDGPFRIGTGEDDEGDHFFKGWIDDIKWYNYSTTLDTAEETGIEDLPAVPERVALSQNYPNPFNPTTQIDFAIPETQQVTLTIYDLLGRQVKVLRDQVHQPGRYTVTWDGTNVHGTMVSSGMYFYRLETEKSDVNRMRKMILLR